MYLIELIVKWINPKKKYERKTSYDPFLVDNESEEDCEHIFLPIDSIGETLACSKCGLVISKDEKP